MTDSKSVSNLEGIEENITAVNSQVAQTRADIAEFSDFEGQADITLSTSDTNTNVGGNFDLSVDADRDSLLAEVEQNVRDALTGTNASGEPLAPAIDRVVIRTDSGEVLGEFIKVINEDGSLEVRLLGE